MGLAGRGRLRLLLDSNVLIWLIAKPKRIPVRIFDAIRDEANEKLVSAATVWETELKRATGRLRLPQSVADAASDAGFLELPVRFPHAIAAANLPRIHTDPFDRMLIAQARLDGLTIVTADRALTRYDVAVLSAR